MSRHLLIVTGYPGSGKSYTTAVILRAFPQFRPLSYDDIKEEWFDREGFDNEEEKRAVREHSLQAFYEQLDGRMKQGEDLLIEYPFCRKHVPALKKLIDSNRYTPVTIVLDGDPEVLWQRFTKRNQMNDRHPGHLCSVYHKDGLQVRAPLLSLEAYTLDCAEKDYYINLGATMTLDMTDLGKVNYDGLLAFLRGALKDKETGT